MNKNIVLILLMSMSVNANDLLPKEGESRVESSVATLQSDAQSKPKTKRQKIKKAIGTMVNRAALLGAGYEAWRSFSSKPSFSSESSQFKKYDPITFGWGETAGSPKIMGGTYTSGYAERTRSYSLYQAKYAHEKDALALMDSKLRMHIEHLWDSSESDKPVNAEKLNDAVSMWQTAVRDLAYEPKAVIVSVGDTHIHLSGLRKEEEWTPSFRVILVTKKKDRQLRYDDYSECTSIPRCPEQQCLIACTPDWFNSVKASDSISGNFVVDNAVKDATSLPDDKIGNSEKILHYVRKVAQAENNKPGRIMIIPLTKNGGGDGADPKKVEKMLFNQRLTISFLSVVKRVGVPCVIAKTILAAAAWSNRVAEAQ